MPLIARLISNWKCIFTTIFIALMFFTVNGLADNTSGYDDVLYLQSPSTGDTCYKGRYCLITWYPDDLQPDQPLIIIARKGGKRYRRIATVTLGDRSYLWTVPAEPESYPPGDDYQIVIKLARNRDIKSAGGRFSIKPVTETPLVLRDFKINNGAMTTTNPLVTLNHTLQGFATHYRACENSNFQGSNCGWRAYRPAPTFQLSSGFGTRTVYFQVKNNAGSSRALSDSIELINPDYNFRKWDPGIKSVTITNTEPPNYLKKPKKHLYVPKKQIKYRLVLFRYRFTSATRTSPLSPYDNIRVLIEYISQRGTQRTTLKTLSYGEGRESTGGIIHTGVISLNSLIPRPGDKIRISIVLPQGFNDINNNNNVREIRIPL